MTGSAAYWNRIADKYAAKPVTDKAAYERKLAETGKRLTPDMNVLEFGCGTGSTALVHAPNVASLKAIDISDRMIEICREKAVTDGIDNVAFSVGTLEDLSDPDASFDAVLGMNILHLLPRYNDAIAKVYRLLKPGGRFFSSTVCMKDGNPLMRFVLPVMRLFGVAPHVSMFGSPELIEAMIAAGFEIELKWHPEKDMVVFLIAQKPENASSVS